MGSFLANRMKSKHVVGSDMMTWFYQYTFAP